MRLALARFCKVGNSSSSIINYVVVCGLNGCCFSVLSHDLLVTFTEKVFLILDRERVILGKMLIMKLIGKVISVCVMAL